MPRRTKFDAVSDAKKLREEAEKKLQAALRDLTSDVGERMQQLFGMEEAHEALTLLEEEFKKTKKAQRMDRLRTLLTVASSERTPSVSDGQSSTSST